MVGVRRERNQRRSEGSWGSFGQRYMSRVALTKCTHWHSCIHDFKCMHSFLWPPQNKPRAEVHWLVEPCGISVSVLVHVCTFMYVCMNVKSCTCKKIYFILYKNKISPFSTFLIFLHVWNLFYLSVQTLALQLFLHLCP